MAGYHKAGKNSRNDIRRELILDEGDAVAQVQLALFQPLDLQHIRAWGHLQGLDRGIEVTMLLEETRQLGAELAFFLTCHMPQRLKAARAPGRPRRNLNKYRALSAGLQGRGGRPSGFGLRGFAATHTVTPVDLDARFWHTQNRQKSDTGGFIDVHPSASCGTGKEASGVGS